MGVIVKIWPGEVAEDDFLKCANEAFFWKHSNIRGNEYSEDTCERK
jgi:hypothetical protein